MGKKDKLWAKEHLTVHHIIGRCNHRWADVQDKTNKMLLTELKHRSFNTVFEQAQSPHEQLEKMLEMWEPVLSEVVKEELRAILSLPKGAFYREDLIKKKYQDRELFSDDMSHFYKETL